MIARLKQHATDRARALVRPALVLMVLLAFAGPVSAAANFTALATLITSLGEVISAFVGIVPDIVTLLAYFAVATFIVGIFGVILSKMKMS